MGEQLGFLYLGLRAGQLGLGNLEERILTHNLPYNEVFNAGMDRRIGAAISEEAILGATSLLVQHLAGAAKATFPHHYEAFAAIEQTAQQVARLNMEASLLNFSLGLLMRKGNRLFGCGNIIKLAGEGMTQRALNFFDPIHKIRGFFHQEAI